MFNADVPFESVRPPEFTLGGRTYVGVFLSHSEWTHWSRRFVTAHEDGRPFVLARFYYELTDACFPRPWWRVWSARVADLVASLPLVVQLQAVEDFCSSQAIALGYSVTPTRTPALGRTGPGETGEEPGTAKTTPRPGDSPLATSSPGSFAATAPAPTGIPPSPHATEGFPPRGTICS